MVGSSVNKLCGCEKADSIQFYLAGPKLTVNKFNWVTPPVIVTQERYKRVTQSPLYLYTRVFSPPCHLFLALVFLMRKVFPPQIIFVDLFYSTI